MRITMQENGTREHGTVVAATEEQFREEAVAILQRKRKFGRDAIAYVAVNAILWFVWALADRSSDPIPWPLWVSTIWGILLAADAWRAFAPWPRSFRPITEEDVDREVRRLRATSPPKTR